MRIEIPRWNFRISTEDRLQYRVVDEDVLVLRLYHVVALRAQARHVTIDIDRLLVSYSLQHRVDDDKRPRAPDPCTTPAKKTEMVN